ncbi:MAG: MlaD family protein [Solirubrobacterales bacterium]
MRRQGVADNPVLVGAGAILVILVMVVLSYNANSGLPFVPTYNIKANVPSGANLVNGNDVRIGGARVGLVTSITPETDGNGKYYAQLALKLDKNIGPIPKDSVIEVRPKSTIGLKYIQLTLGDSNQDLPNGATLPITQSRIATEFEDLLDTFDERVREGNKKSLNEFGNAFAGRGADLNTAFGELTPLFENLEPVAKTVSAPSTRFADFIRALARAAHDTAVTGDQAGEVFANADRTFAAFAAASEGIKQSLAESPPTLTVLTDEFPGQRRYFAQLTDVIEKFQPGAPYLPAVSSDLASITRNGPSAFRHLSRTTPKFNNTLIQVGNFAADPQVQMGFKGLGNFLQILNQPLAYVTPSQTVCNYPAIFARNIASAVSSRDGGAGWLRFSPVGGPANPSPAQNAEAGPASANADFAATSAAGDVSNRLHANGYPSTGQNNVCAAGNEVTKGSKKDTNFFLSKERVVGNPSGLKSGQTTDLDTNAIGGQQVKTK